MAVATLVLALAMERSAGAECAMHSRLVWRGIDLGGPAFEPSVHGALGGWSLGTSAAISTSRQERTTFATGEVSYAWKRGAFQLRPGASAYATFSSVARVPATAEASIFASFEAQGFGVFTAHSVDLRSALGGYFGELGVTYERELHALTLSAFAELGWASAAYERAYFDLARGGAELAALGTAARLDVGEWLYLGLHAELSALLSPALARSGGQSSTLFDGGASVGFEFD